jgi:succinate dehydrogenase / fumarate reductase membrane anchor subunit
MAMVSNVSSANNRGIRDWFIQRISAVVIAAYFLFLLVYIVTTPGMDFYDWQAIFQLTWVRIFSTIFLLMLILHAWIGVWTVITDYLKNTTIRLSSQLIVIFVLLSCFLWGIQILWGA